MDNWTKCSPISTQIDEARDTLDNITKEIETLENENSNLKSEIRRKLTYSLASDLIPKNGIHSIMI